MKARVELNITGIREVLTSPGVKRIVDTEADRIAAKAGPGFVVLRHPRQQFSARAYVVAATREARIRQARNRVLTRAAISKGG